VLAPRCGSSSKATTACPFMIELRFRVAIALRELVQPWPR